MMPDRPPGPDELAAVEGLVDRWLAEEADGNPVVASVERGEADPAEGARARWYVRLTGEQKPVFAVWFTLRQRTLHYETYVMPAPETNAGELYEHLLRRNQKLRGIAFCIGVEDAVFLAGETDVRRLDERTLDQILGSLYEATERCFRPAMRLGFAGKYTG